jgi:hypothetical protein
VRDGGRSWRERLRTGPLLGVVVAAGVLTSVGSLALLGLLHVLTGWPHDPDWIETAVQQFFIGAVAAWVPAASVRRSGGPEVQRIAQVALKRGRLPRNGNPAVLRRSLAEQRRIASRARTWVLVVLPLLAGALLWLAVVQGGVELWVAGGALAATAVLVPIALRRRVELADALLDDLFDAADPADPELPPPS